MFNLVLKLSNLLILYGQLVNLCYHSKIQYGGLKSLVSCQRSKSMVDGKTT